MLCKEIVSDIQNIFCTQHVLHMFCKKKELLTKIYLYKLCVSEKREYASLLEELNLCTTGFFVSTPRNNYKLW